MINDLIPSHRRSVRLKEYDYSSPGAYFVTVVTYQSGYLFWEVVDGEMRLNPYGQIVKQSWEWLATQYPYVDIDPYVVMPNHFHGILQIIESDDHCRGGSRPAPTKIKPMGQLIGVFKTISAKQINLTRGTPGLSVWQRNYYEHIVRDQTNLASIAGYILANPTHQLVDPEHIH